MSNAVKPHSPPSSYAIAALIKGEEGAAAEVARVTAKRAALIWPGVWAYQALVGPSMPLRQQVGMTAFISLSITGGLYLYYRSKME